MTALTHAHERGSMTELAIVRLADEGVPIKALVRVFRRPFDEVEGLLRDARDAGRIIDLPAADWPADSRRDGRLPTIAPERGAVPDEDLIFLVRRAFALPRSLAVLLAQLVWRGRSSKAWLHELLETGAEPKIVDVFICKLRKVLAPYQISIETIWGYGYSIDEAGRGAIVARLRAIAPGTVIRLDEAGAGAA